MPTAVTNYLKPKFTLVTSSAAIAIITRPQISFDKNWQLLPPKYKLDFLQWCMTFNVEKVVFKISQGSVATQTMLGGLSIYPPVANFLIL